MVQHISWWIGEEKLVGSEFDGPDADSFKIQMRAVKRACCVAFMEQMVNCYADGATKKLQTALVSLIRAIGFRIVFQRFISWPQDFTTDQPPAIGQIKNKPCACVKPGFIGKTLVIWFSSAMLLF